MKKQSNSSQTVDIILTLQCNQYRESYHYHYHIISFWIERCTQVEFGKSIENILTKWKDGSGEYCLRMSENSVINGSIQNPWSIKALEFSGTESVNGYWSPWHLIQWNCIRERLSISRFPDFKIMLIEKNKDWGLRRVNMKIQWQSLTKSPQGLNDFDCYLRALLCNYEKKLTCAFPLWISDTITVKSSMVWKFGNNCLVGRHLAKWSFRKLLRRFDLWVLR